MGIQNFLDRRRSARKHAVSSPLIDPLEPRRLFAATAPGTYPFGGRTTASVTDADGTTAKFSLPAGQGTVTVADDGWHVAITKSTPAASLVVTTTGGDGRVSIADFSTSRPLGSVNASKANLSGSLSLTNVKSLSLGSAADLSITSSTPITSLTAASWTDNDSSPDALTAPSIATLNVKGNFAPSLTLTSAQTALKSATVGGAVTGAWSVAGSAGTLKLHAVRSPDFSIAGNVTTLSLDDYVAISPVASATGGVLHLGGKGSVLAAAGKDKFKIANTTTLYTCTAATYSYSDLTGNTQVGSTHTYTRKGKTQVTLIDKYVSSGYIQTTGTNTDLAINGDGFFVVNGPDGQQYTRDGSFTLNADHQLVTSSGAFVQGYGVDSAGSVVVGRLQNITIPLGSQAAAQATSRVMLQGTLDTAGAVATDASVFMTQPLQEAGGIPISTTTLLTDVESVSAPGVPLFSSAPGSNVLTLTAKKGTGASGLTSTFTVTPTSTVQDLMDFFNGSLGIDTTAGGPGPAPGAALGGAFGDQLVITGNAGAGNTLSLAPAALRNSATSPFAFATDPTHGANGESVSTSLTAYDSLGQPVTIRLTTVLESKSSTGTTWRFYATSPDNTNGNLVVGNGTLQFDGSGMQISSTGTDVTIDRSNTGANPTLNIKLDFTDVAAADQANSVMVLEHQNGETPGKLQDFSVGTDGMITGTYSNGVTHTLGQIVIAKFDNAAGLVDAYTYQSPGTNGETDTYSVDPADGTRLIHQDADSDAVSLNASFTGPNALLVAPATLTLGATTHGTSPLTFSINDEGVGGTLHGTASATTRFAGHELITTPAGTFLAAKVVTTLAFNTSGVIGDGQHSAGASVVVGTTYTQWFVTGLGAVRIDTARAVTIKVPTANITRTHNTSTRDELATRPAAV